VLFNLCNLSFDLECNSVTLQRFVVYKLTPFCLGCTICWPVARSHLLVSKNKDYRVLIMDIKTITKEDTLNQVEWTLESTYIFVWRFLMFPDFVILCFYSGNVDHMCAAFCLGYQCFWIYERVDFLGYQCFWICESVDFLGYQCFWICECGFPRLPMFLILWECGFPRLPMFLILWECGFPRLPMFLNLLECGFPRLSMFLNLWECGFPRLPKFLNLWVWIS